MAKRKLTDPFIRNHKNPNKRIEIYDNLVNGLAIRITTAGSKSFVFRYRFRNKVKRYTMGRFPDIGLAKAREQARELSWQVSNGIDPLEEKRKRKEPEQKFMFLDLSNQFITRHLPQLRKRTRDEYKRIIKKELNSAFKKYQVQEISRKQIIKLLDRIAIDNKTPVYSNRVRAVLSSMFSFGIKKAMLEINPVLTIPRKKKRPNGEPVERKRKRTYIKEEIQAIWEQILIQDEPIRSIFMMLLICGQRSSETRRMKWDHVDFENRTWTIPAQETKAFREHTIPLSDLAMEVLEGITDFTGHSKYVFPSRTDPEKPMEWLQKAAERIRDNSEVSDFRIHDLRRTAATYMAELGTDRTVLGKVLNHKELAGDRQVTAIYDRHDYLEEKREALQKWSDYLKQILNRHPELNV